MKRNEGKGLSKEEIIGVEGKELEGRHSRHSRHLGLCLALVTKSYIRQLPLTKMCKLYMR